MCVLKENGTDGKIPMLGIRVGVIFSYNCLTLVCHTVTLKFNRERNSNIELQTKPAVDIT